ncbi:group II intron reverse transcriptase/maturase, partial [Christensenellaceae bacterium OttesenSCG-928-M15]|nr:group II intron reverse transcriptase/maturase [Christensenellaceae bacterium OttesenSCG-928-M15]
AEYGKVPGCRLEDRVEPEDKGGARSIASREAGEGDGAGCLLERILDRDNLNRAYKRVKSNSGAAGIDGMTVEEMLPWLKEHRQELLEELANGRYKPKPVRRVEIPKPDGGVRKLGVPTVIDRMVQQAMVQILQPIFEPVFSEASYGYRPGRSAQQAMKRAKEYYEQGYTRVADIDLSKYFDTMNHDLLLGYVRREVKDERVIGLIKKFLKSGVMEDGVVSKTAEGSPQGGPLSPLLSNIYLNEFDKEMERRGMKHLRYADDIAVYTKSKRAAERVLESCKRYLEGKLKLKVNLEKSKAGSPLKLKFLGFSLYSTKNGVGIRVHEKTLRKFKAKLKAITKRNRGRSIYAILKELRLYVSGWLNYYAIAGMKNRLQSVNEWLKRRIRQYIWKQWKKPRTRVKNLRKLGIPEERAYMWGNTRKGYWRVAGSAILSRSLTNEHLISLGYMDLSRKYEVLHSNY